MVAVNQSYLALGGGRLDRCNDYRIGSDISAGLIKRLLAVFNVALHLIQAVFELRVIQRLHDYGSRPCNPKTPAGLNDIILQITFLSDP